MQINETVLFAAYLISGIATYLTMRRYKMYFAQTVYAVAFIVLATYFPISAGYNFIYYMLRTRLIPDSESFMYQRLIEPLTRLSPYINTSVIIVIAFSFFFAASLVVFAYRAGRAIYRLVKGKINKRKKIKSFFKHPEDPQTPDFSLVYVYRHIFCRYNC